MTDGTRRALLTLAGAAIVGVSVVVVVRVVSKARFVDALPTAGKPYADQLWRAARAHKIRPVLLAAVIAHESGFGELLTPRGPGGTGDGGHGRGLGQIDDRTWGAWLEANDWRDPAVNLDKSAEILAAALATFPGNAAAGIARYNASEPAIRRALANGTDPAAVTTHDREGRSYVDNVVAQLDRLQA